MPDPHRSPTDRIFAALLRLLPRDFRAAHGAEITQVFRAQRRDAAASRGRAGLVRLWIAAVAGLLVTGPREHLTALGADVRYALRTMRRQPVFAVAAIVTFGVGIAASATILAVVNAYLWRPLSVPDPDQLVALANRDQHFELPHGLSYQEIGDYRELERTFSGVIGWSPFPAHLSTGGSAERLWMCAVTDDYFTVLGVPALLGRTIVKAEDQLDTGGQVLVLSHAYWQRRFAADPGVIGKVLTVNGRPFTVVGILPAWFEGTDTLIDMPVFTSLEGTMQAFDAFPRHRRDAHSLRVLARLRPGTSLAEARAAVDVKGRQLATAYPETNQGVSVIVMPERRSRPEPATGSIFQTAALAFGVLVAVLLLIVCANVANLQLARASARAHEIGVRVVLGARPGRLMRQLLTESLLLSGLGAVVGLLLAGWGTSVLRRGLEQYPSSLTLHVDFGLDWRVLAITAGVAVFAGVASGLAPAWQALRRNTLEPLKQGGRTGAGAGRNRRLRDVLVVAQVAFSLALLVVAGLFTRSLDAARNIDVGFSARNMLLLSADPYLQGYDQSRRLAYYEGALERVRALPGVRAATWTTFVPFTGNTTLSGVEAESAPVRPNEQPSTLLMFVADDYFATMGMPLERGRSFDEHDDQTTRQVAIVNHTLARQLWPGEDPIGRRLSMNGPDGPWKEVVGVVRDAKYLFLWEDPRPMVMLPFRQDVPYGATLEVVTDGDAASLTAMVRASVGELDPDLPLYDVKTLERHLRDGNAFGPLHLAADMASVVGVLGLVLALVGLYGVLAYSVSQRAHEIGVRIALGAARGRIIRLVVRHGLALCVAGLALGTLLAAWMTGPIGSLLVGINPGDPGTYVTTAAVLLGVALLACYVPARRALRVDPVTALRAE